MKITIEDWTLPFRQRADALFREGRIEEASRLLSGITRIFQGGERAASAPSRAEPEDLYQPQSVTWRKL